ncbi:MAG: hypothetical protein U0Q07_05985 [Acidimicrobiales bacterium]
MRPEPGSIAIGEEALSHFIYLGPDALLVCLGLSVLAEHQASTEVVASLRALEDRTGLRKDRVARALTRLARVSAVAVVGRSEGRGRPTIYRLDLHAIGITGAGAGEHELRQAS